MTDPVRITEMVGISSSDHDTESVWPLNFVLVVLGASILAVAFSFLDMADPRPLYNPWTYAIATPVALMGLSALLSLVVSRLVEKSMQLAFLLSVLIHLILMVGAMNVVIFSRMWPDMLDSLAQQREQLKRETLRAKQYHRVSINKQSGKRPDYLKPAPTEHQPTEVELAESARMALARSDRANLVSPSPKLELSHSPSLLEREQSTTSLPSRSEQAASLSRSDIAVPRVANTSPTFDSQSLDNSQPAPIGPSPAALARKSDNRHSDLNQAPALQLDVRGRQADALDRQTPVTSAPQQLPPQQPQAIDRQRLADVQPSRQAADELSFPEGTSSPATPAEVSPSSLSSDQRRSSSARGATVSPLSRLPAPESSSIKALANNNTLINRAPQRALSPSPAAGDTAAVLPRNTAGGSLGTAAPSSMPVRGIDDVGITQPAPNMEARIDSIVSNSRRSSQASSMSQLPSIGTLGASSWNGTPTLSGGTDGRSLSQLTRNTEQGSAAVQDTAQFSGADRDLVRSALGRNGAPSPTAVAGVDSLAELANPTSGMLDFSGDNPAALAASGATIGRSSSSSITLTPAPGSEPSSAPLSSSSSIGQSLGATTRTESPTALVGTSSSDSAATGQLPKNNAFASNVPVRSTISVPELPDISNSASDAGAQPPQSSGGELARRSAAEQRAVSAAPLTSNLLTVDAPFGPGGIATSSEVVGALLNRRDSSLDRWPPPQLEAQRLARQDVGGPLAAGQVALPKPAFQQRIDRLKDRNPQDESSIEPQTELAIERGLEFLAKHQRADGSWRLQDFDTPVLMRSDTAATGLALLAFQGAGYTHNQFKYAATVDKALQFLVKHQTATGDLYLPQDPASDQNAWLYSHAIATLALCEAVGMTQDDKLRAAAQKAIDFMVVSQDPKRGGWRYRPGSGADTSVTGWFMMAFKSGQLAGLKVPEPTMQAIEKFVSASQSPDGEPHLYRYNPFAADTPEQRHGLKPTSVMTSVGLLMRLYFGWKRDRPEMMAGADYLLQHPPEHGSPTVSKRDTYYWYYATQFMFHMRGKWWKEWHDELYPLLIKTQITDGELSGSWDPYSPTPDLWARYGGRHYVTTLNLLSLEVSYRHLPLYEATAK